MDTPKNLGGRPEKPAELRLISKSIRMTQAQWDKVALHGLDWLRDLVDKGKPPKTARTAEARDN